MFHYKKISKQEFDDIANMHPNIFIPIEQSPIWDSFDNLMPGRQTKGVFGYFDTTTNNNLIATARINIVTQPLRTSIVITRGPVWYINPSLDTENKLIQTIKKQFYKINPLYLRMQIHNNKLEAAIKPFEIVTFDRTIYVDISIGKDALLKSFKPDARQSIKKAYKLGVRVSEIPQNKSIDFFKKNNLMNLMQETQFRNRFRAHPISIYLNTLKALPDNARLYVAYIDGKVVSWLISTEYRKHAVYLYAAGGAEARKKFASYALQWHCMQEMIKRNNKIWDMTGIESPNFPNAKNVTCFKRKFSSWEIQLPLVYDVLFDNKIHYKIVGLAYKARRKFL